MMTNNATVDVAWMRSENRRKCGTTLSVPMLICWNVFGLSMLTFDEPPNMVSAIPPLAFSS